MIEKMNTKEGLPPIVSQQTRILILGTAPANKSLNKKRYYQNNDRFWKILSSILNKKITKENYEEELPKTEIGLWDVFNIFEVEGESSLDKKRDYKKTNEFNDIFEKNENIKYIVFNGGNSAHQISRFLEENRDLLKEKKIRVFTLPSLSGINGNYKKPEDLLDVLWADLFYLLTQK